ncbi:MAG: hypothetical protein WA916_13635 [Arcobacter sp.]|uniref:hypothetical protein n=1 Tax=Arcobacter sp. TaxID=1872629 RepID=UPI003C7075E7
MAASQITETITELDPVKIPVEGQDPEIFRSNAGYVWGKLRSIVLNLNTFRTQANTVATEINNSALQVAENKQYVLESKEIITTTMSSMPEGSINDTTASGTTTYSSNKIDSLNEALNEVLNDSLAYNLNQTSGAIATLKKDLIESISKAIPIGTQSLEVLESPRPNQLIQSGGTFNRVDYPELWAFIQTQTTLLKNDTDWQTENNANAMCGYFSDGDGSTTFRLMNLIDATLKATTTAGVYEPDGIKSHGHSGSAGVAGNHNHNASTTLRSPDGTSSYGTIAFSKSSSSGGNFSFTISTNGAHTHPLSISNTGNTYNTVRSIGALPLIVAK